MSSLTMETSSTGGGGGGSGSKDWIVVLVCASITCSLLRLSIHWIQQASAASAAAAAAAEDDKNKTATTNAATTTTTTNNDQKKKSADSGYGSVQQSEKQRQQGTTTPTTTDEEEQRPLLVGGKAGVNRVDANKKKNVRKYYCYRFVIWLVWIVALIIFVLATLTTSTKVSEIMYGPVLFPTDLVVGSALFVALEMLAGLSVRKPMSAQRWFHLAAVAVLWCEYALLVIQSLHSHQWWNNVSLLRTNRTDAYMMILVTGLVFAAWMHEWVLQQRREEEESDDGDREGEQQQQQQQESSKPALSFGQFGQLLLPYVWPHATETTPAWVNRVRAISTWLCVILSKSCNVVGPLFLGWATTALAVGQYGKTIRYAAIYSAVGWFASTFKEAQSLIYLKVSQAAYVQLAEAAFGHLHHLSLDWHLKKKMGQVLRSMDRGISACNTLMTYLFLWLVPAILECLTVCIIFAMYFSYLPLAILIFYFVFAYIVWTILITVWRKKFRKALVASDNEWHDLFTDSMINFETVKYFTAEAYEQARFRHAVAKYQAGSVHVQASLGFLNVSQQVILKTCLAAALALAATGIQRRADCCVQEANCPDTATAAVSECCVAVSHEVCPGMQVGDFVAVLTYTIQLFQPLFFLGSVYNAIVMAVIDLTHLSELLAENPDVTDAPNAAILPRQNVMDPDVAVEFDNVVFHYPTQNDAKGLKGLSFTMKRGTTTAIVGPTGAGKTTVSRLLFRFYDVLGGSVKVNGVDVRNVTQKSLRGAIGVVPQAASMFNDTIYDNIKYGRQEATLPEVEQAARDAQLLGFIESLEQGWQTLVGDRGLKLSGGEKQRAAIARCLLKDPPLVVLDEATSALDTLTENSVQEALDRLGAERTVLVIAHRLGTIRNADNIVVLRDGVVAEQGTHDQLLERNGLYADMWNMQLHSTSASNSRSNSRTNLDALAGGY